MVADKIASRWAARASRLSRRHLFKHLAGIAALVMAMPLLTDDAAKAQPKQSKEEVKYQTHPNEGHACAACQFFQPPKTCQLVDGDISPAGWCMLWQEKK